MRSSKPAAFAAGTTLLFALILALFLTLFIPTSASATTDDSSSQVAEAPAAEEQVSKAEATTYRAPYPEFRWTCTDGVVTTYTVIIPESDPAMGSFTIDGEPVSAGTYDLPQPMVRVAFNFTDGVEPASGGFTAISFEYMGKDCPQPADPTPNPEPTKQPKPTTQPSVEPTAEPTQSAEPAPSTDPAPEEEPQPTQPAEPAPEVVPAPTEEAPVQPPANPAPATTEPTKESKPEPTKSAAPAETTKPSATPTPAKEAAPETNPPLKVADAHEGAKSDLVPTGMSETTLRTIVAVGIVAAVIAIVVLIGLYQTKRSKNRINR